MASLSSIPVPVKPLVTDPFPDFFIVFYSMADLDCFVTATIGNRYSLMGPDRTVIWYMNCFFMAGIADMVLVMAISITSGRSPCGRQGNKAESGSSNEGKKCFTRHGKISLKFWNKK